MTNTHRAEATAEPPPPGTPGASEGRPGHPRERVPPAVHLVALGIFTMVTSEFAVGGLMPRMAEGLGTGVPQVGYLITAFALAMAVGGPVAATALHRLRPTTALLVLYAVFLTGNALAAAAPGYTVMLVARVVTGAASGAFFGVALSVVARITRPELRGRATGVAMQGLMVGTLLGLPLATFLGELWGWRAAFVAIGVLTVVAAGASAAALPRLDHLEAVGGLGREAAVLRDPRLIGAMLCSTLIIGATFAAFSYFTPILTEVTGFSSGTVPLLLLAYGAATVVGNAVVARFAVSRTLTVIAAGLALNTAFLVTFALAAGHKAPAVVAMAGIGLVGVTMNPAMITRVQRIGNAGPLVNTVHSSFITMGVVVGSWVGGLGVDAFGLRAPLWTGAVLALVGLATLLPSAARRLRE
ncbi:MFS transporter [Nocardiopsis halophila]|uniref:MFS transporter n=1 Tax=Nocardiopsis halophila TaxID=141692 RepID=UPI0003494617|nr:MFS transporter [Nocardiopsis halophila]